MDPVLAALLTETVLLAPFLGLDAYGKPNYGAAVATPACIERDFQTTVMPTGPQIVEETKVFCDGTAVLDDRTQLTLPDGAQPPIKGLKPVKDEYGQMHHWEVFL